MPWLFSAAEYVPAGLAMWAGGAAEDKFDINLLNNPIVQAALIKGVGHTQKAIQNKTLDSKIYSKLKGTLAEVLSAFKQKNTEATGTYGIKLIDKDGNVKKDIAKKPNGHKRKSKTQTKIKNKGEVL